MDRLQGRRARATHRLALSPSCWGVSEVKDWGHQIDAERVLSECAAVGEGAITAGPPGFLPDRSDHARKLLRRNRLQVVAGQVQAILHHHETRGPELAHIDGHAHWLAAIGGETLVLSAIPEREAGSTRPDELSNAQWAHLLHLIGSVEAGKLADLVLWKPSFFGAKPEMVIKGGIIAWAQMGDPNASIPTPQPVYMRPMFGAFGRATGGCSVAFVSQACEQERVAAERVAEWVRERLMA